MKRACPITLMALASFALLALTEGNFAQQRGPARRVLIGFKDGTGRQAIEGRRALIRGRGGEVRRSYRFLPTVSAELPEAQISSLRADPRVAYIEEDGLVHALDAELDNSWGVKRIGAGNVHPSNKGTGVKVAIIDTGIDYTHPDLNGNYVGGHDFVNDDADPKDDEGHGTHVAGIIAAEDNDNGVVGVAPQASLYAVKVLDSGGSGYISDVVAGIEWAIEEGAHIISMSLGTNSNYQTLRDACDQASAAGILVVAAAGNDYAKRRGTEQDTVDYPARYNSVIAVGATDTTNARASWSSTGPALELAAPGVAVYSTYMGGGYATMSGTSMACPHVAGTAALILAANPGANVRSVLQETADDLGASGRDKWYGFGLVDADEAAGTPAGNQVPVADAGPDQIVNDSDDNGSEMVTLTGSGSDADGTIETYEWTEGTTVLGDTGSITRDFIVGVHTVTLTVTDNEGASGSDQVVITVKANQPPTANAGPDQIVNDSDDNGSEMVTLTGSGSDADGTIETYEWTEGTTVLGDTASIMREFSVGEHTVTLTVTDNGGATASDTVTITVSPPSELSETEFAFSGTVAPRGESRHVVSVSGPATMSVRLTWLGWGDLRLRIYNPSDKMVAQVDRSTFMNNVEEITIEIAQQGDWQVAARSDDAWRSTSYTIEGLVEY